MGNTPATSQIKVVSVNSNDIVEYVDPTPTQIEDALGNLCNNRRDPYCESLKMLLFCAINSQKYPNDPFVEQTCRNKSIHDYRYHSNNTEIMPFGTSNYYIDRLMEGRNTSEILNKKRRFVCVYMDILNGKYVPKNKTTS